MPIKWSNETRNIETLNEAPYNPRKMSRKQAKDLKTSLDKFSLVDPVIINLDGTIIGGHMRVKVLKKDGIGTVEVRVPDRQLTPAEEKELNLRLNRNVGDWDWDLLAAFDKNELIDFGFDDKDIRKLLDDNLHVHADSYIQCKDCKAENADFPCRSCGKTIEIKKSDIEYRS